VEPLPSGSVQEVHASPASLWRRLGATFVDTALLGAVVFAYMTLASTIAGSGPQPASFTALDVLVHRMQSWQSVLIPGAVLGLVLGAAYAAVFSLLWGGRTPGRAVFGIRLVDASGRPPGPVRGLIRAILSLVSFLALLAGFWMALFDRRGQTLHDKLTRTFVVR
jgi:uncharacterized RDD family membrane protein YckC